MVEKRKLPWGMLAALLVGLLVISYFLSGLTTLDGVTLANWQDKLLYVILHPLQNWWNDLTFTFMGIALIVWIGIVTYLMDYYRNRQVGVEYGSEQWADIKQIQRTLMNKEETKNTLLSQNVAVDNGKLSNMNMLVIGNSGSYKSTTLVIPNALLASMTNVFLDIKGELLRKTGKYLQNQVENLLPGPVRFFDVTIYADGKPIEDLIPNVYRKKKKDKTRLSLNIDYKGAPWVKNMSRPYEISRGLDNRHIALWQSHGQYFKNDKGEWGWQRPRLFCTTEDLFTQSFILPYVIPMLENAGANVFTPRERDTQKNEVIVDNDTKDGSVYLEVKSRKARWEVAAKRGFARTKRVYRDGENPFLDGTARYARTEKKKNKAFAEWIPTIPESGNYAVYVSYQTLPNSVSDAKYLVFHKGGVTEFKVNQQIGGGTWVYLGTFEFDKGNNDYGMVVLSNESKEDGVVCADAVRFGGGMGNISRGGNVSGLPRYLEGARYSAQWGGMPYEVYAGKKGENDYTDDINVRSNALNYLSGGSVFNPKEKGLGVPLEMAVALHSDAGHSRTDEIIGSLGIYTTDFNNGQLNTGIDRYASRDLSDILLTQIQNDIRAAYNIPWTRRSMWNRNYSETRLPSVPSTIIELLSHQNFADMQLGHTVGRAIYKGVLRFINSQHGKESVVQPLPVSNFAIRFGKKKNTLELSWQGENDPLEPTATPREYMGSLGSGG